MLKADVAIIGAGVVGLAIARELSQTKQLSSLIVLERFDSFGRETSSRNSEVIHGGMYYPTNSLKARLCVEGRRLLYEACPTYKIPFKKTGKLIIATEKDELNDLEKLYGQGKLNGVKGLTMFTQQEMNATEPHLKGIAALFSPETGIIDSHRLMEFLYDTAKGNGVMVSFQSEVTGLKKTNDGYEIEVFNNGETTFLKSRYVINSAGLDSDRIAAMVGLDVQKLEYELHYCRGEYFRVASNKAGMVERLIYPAPKPKRGGLGIHVTLDLAGGMRLGPDDEYSKNREKNYLSDNSKRRDFFMSASQFLPFLEESDLSADTVGIRPKLQGPDGNFRDFIIQEETKNGFNNFINLIGIESPGLTASLAIALYVKNIIAKMIS